MGNGENTIEALAKLDKEFHLHISEASSNVNAHEFLFHRKSPFVQINQAIFFRHRYCKMGIEHQTILEAINAHDSEVVENTIRAQISHVS